MGMMDGRQLLAHVAASHQ